eukprot:scaffold339133_cov43-Prasinocladus_malaysianus.AAC.1
MALFCPLQQVTMGFQLQLLFFLAIFATAYGFRPQGIELPVRSGNDTDGKHWALLVAGSAGFGNYRHQADICHAYQILRQGGIPDENII